jgi:MFS family permease
VGVALLQSSIVGLMALLAVAYGFDLVGRRAVTILVLLSIVYFSCLNTIQPHWRAWMGGLVPRRRRGVFFAARTRLTMGASLLVFITGGVVLSQTDNYNRAWLGFALLFASAAVGRLISAVLLSRMHDPEPETARNTMPLLNSWRHITESLKEPTFRHYSFFVAAMQGAVAVSAPFFAVYMLRDLNFTYLQFSLNAIASILTQFIMLNFWGRFSDRFGNHLTMVIASSMIPAIPLLWLLSPSYGYLIVIQMLSGFSWSAFTLSTANYLYDIRPHHTNFALYAAIQSGTSALLVFAGALLGGYVARHAADMSLLMADFWEPRSALFLVFITSALLRVVVVAVFLPRLKEPKLRHRPKFLNVIYRVARFNAISGISLDWMSVTKKSAGGDKNREEGD